MDASLQATEKYYACIDLKCFYASVECVERGLDPFKANLVVADPARSRGAICLAISPALKQLGVRNRCRLYEIPSWISYITALPQMRKYMEYSSAIYRHYLDFLSADDIYVYSIDECFIDLSPYLVMYKKTPRELTKMLMEAIYEKFGICATGGIGTNMFLAKVALDVQAKYKPDHIAYLDEETFKKTMWHHRPLTDIWNIGKGTARRLERHGIVDLHGITVAEPQCIYKEFGVNAEYLLDHAWGRESCTMRQLKSYRAKTHSIANSQILFEDYAYEEALIVVIEMVEFLALELVEKQLLCSSISLSVHYSKEYQQPTGASRHLPQPTDSFKVLEEYFKELYLDVVVKDASIRKLAVNANNLIWIGNAEQSLFSSYDVDEEKDRDMQQALLDIKEKYGKNSILRGISYREKATGKLRNTLIGGHNGG